jgi:hypothetical protein
MTKEDNKHFFIYGYSIFIERGIFGNRKLGYFDSFNLHRKHYLDSEKFNYIKKQYLKKEQNNARFS